MNFDEYSMYMVHRKEVEAMSAVAGYGRPIFTTTGVILVLFILLVIVSRAFI